MWQNKFKIANIVFQIESEEAFTIEEAIRCYCADDELQTGDVIYKVLVDEEFENVTGKILYQGIGRVILDKDGQECRIHFLPGTQIPFAYVIGNEIHLLERYFPNRILSIIFLELLALEKHLLMEKALVLHSAYIICEGKAVLFTAPSGTGKSTQAKLWEKYKGAKVINGDRSIVQVREDWVESHGIPFCGTSGISLNESAPLAGIVILEQAKENSIERCRSSVSIKKLFSECSINYWNQDFVNEALNVIEKIVEKIPVCHLKCNISEEAVDVTYKELFHE